MANKSRRRTTTVATALLAGSAVAAAAMLARRRADKPRAVIPSLELTPSHRAGTGTPLLLLHGDRRHLAGLVAGPAVSRAAPRSHRADPARARWWAAT